jgi:hypothetical protein
VRGGNVGVLWLWIAKGLDSGQLMMPRIVVSLRELPHSLPRGSARRIYIDVSTVFGTVKLVTAIICDASCSFMNMSPLTQATRVIFGVRLSSRNYGIAAGWGLIDILGKIAHNLVCSKKL